MSSLITYAQYCALTGTTGTTGTTDQTLLENTVIPAVSEACERYCDRQFALSTVVEWQADSMVADGLWEPRQYPIVAMLGAYDTADGLTVENLTSSDLTITVSKVALTVSDPSALTTTEYLFSTSATLVDLVDDLTVSDEMIATSLVGNSTNSKLLKPGTYLLEGGATVTIPIGVATNATPSKITDIMLVDLYADAIAYRGGYAAIPMDLQRVVAAMCKDALSVSKGQQVSAGLRSESLGKYSYTVADGIDLANLVSTYAGQLDSFRRAVWA